MNTLTKLTATVFLISGTALQAGLPEIIPWCNKSKEPLEKAITESKLTDFNTYFNHSYIFHKFSRFFKFIKLIYIFLYL